MIIYPSNTNIQSIYSFDLGKVKDIKCRVQIYGTDNTMSEIDIIHDGVQILETQEATSTGIPKEITTDIIDYRGNILIQPDLGSQIHVDIEETEAVRYGEHTKSGRLISTDTGISFLWESTLPSVTIRQDGNNIYSDPDLYFDGTKLGPIATLSELGLGEWQSYNFCDQDEGKAISSGQIPNFLYQEIETIPNHYYGITGSAYHSLPDDVVVKENPNYQRGDSFIRVSENLQDSELVNYQTPDVSTPFTHIFQAKTDRVYIKYGYGERSLITHMEDFSLREYVPFHTYNQERGKLIIHWKIGNTKLLGWGDNVLETISGDVYFNDVNIGPVLSNNIVSLTYNFNDLVLDINGNIHNFTINNSGVREVTLSSFVDNLIFEDQ